jgi:hypothetical protein
MRKVTVGAVSAIVAVFACSAGARPRPPLLAVGGAYKTHVSLVPNRNTCGAVTVQDNMTTVKHTEGAHTLSVTHVGNTYQGTVEDTGQFATTPLTLSTGDGALTISIAGRFTRTGFDATVQVDQKRSTPPPTCSYAVHWVGTKQGAPNTIPDGL